MAVWGLPVKGPGRRRVSDPAQWRHPSKRLSTPIVERSTVRQPGITTGVDAREGFQIHGHVQRQAVVGAVAADLDAQRGDLAQPGELGVGRRARRRCRPIAAAVAAPARHGPRGVIQSDIDPGGALHAVAGDAEMPQCADRGLFESVHVLLDKVPGALEIEQRVGHDLPRAMVGDLSTPVGGDDRDGAGVKHMLRPPCKSLRENRRVFADP